MADLKQLRIRLRPQVHRSLARAAKRRDWTLTEEIASRLERSLQETEALGGAANQNIVDVMATTYVAAMHDREPDQAAHVGAVVAVMRALMGALRVEPDAVAQEAIKMGLIQQKLKGNDDDGHDRQTRTA